MSTERVRSSLVLPIAAAAAVAVGLAGMIRVVEGSSGAWSSLVSAGFGPIALVGGLAGLHWMLSASAWSQIVAAVSGHRIGVPTASAHLALSSLGKYVPGKIWGFGLRGAALHRRGVGVGPIAAASAIEQLYLLLSGLAVAGLALGIGTRGWFRWPVIAAALAIGALLVAGSHPRVAGVATRLVQRRARPDTAPPTLDRWSSVRLTVTFAALWLALGGAFTLVALTVTDLDRSVPTVAVLVGTIAVSYLGGFAALFVPAGLGVREGVGAAILTARGGLAPEVAVAAMVSFRLVTVLVELLAAGLSFRRLVECVRA